MTRYGTESPFIPVEHGGDGQLEVQFFWSLDVAEAVSARFYVDGSPLSETVWTFALGLLSTAIGAPERLSGEGDVQFKYSDFGLVIFLDPHTDKVWAMHIEEHYVNVYLKPWLVNTLMLWDQQGWKAQLAMEQSVDRALTMIFEGSN